MIKFDCHTHSIMSGHAFSTVEEIAAACASKGLEGFALTDHGPAMPSSAQSVYFEYLPMLPKNLNDIHILNGIEANIIDYEGKLDIEENLCKRLDVVIASFHDIVLKPSSSEDHTSAYLRVISNPYVDIIGHPGRGLFVFDINRVITACKMNNKIVEINNQTLIQEDNPAILKNIVSACKDIGVNIVVSSDAHISRHVGRVDLAMRLLDEIDFPVCQIANLTFDSFIKKLSNHKSSCIKQNDH